MPKPKYSLIDTDAFIWATHAGRNAALSAEQWIILRLLRVLLRENLYIDPEYGETLDYLLRTMSIEQVRESFLELAKENQP